MKPLKVPLLLQMVNILMIATLRSQAKKSIQSNKKIQIFIYIWNLFRKDVCYLGTKQTYPQNQNIPQVDQQTLSLLKKLNADIIQENSKFMCSQMNFNSNNIFPGFPNFQNLSFPLQNNNIQNNPLLQNLRCTIFFFLLIIFIIIC